VAADEIRTIHWVDPLDGALIELDVPVDVAEKMSRGEAVARRGDYPRRRFETKDAIARLQARQDQIRARMAELEAADPSLKPPPDER
jgi:hypothetical protein